MRLQELRMLVTDQEGTRQRQRPITWMIFNAPGMVGAWLRQHALLMLPIVLTILVRVPFFFWPLSVDEGSYAYTAHWWFRSLTLYSNDLWFDRPQGIFLAYQVGLQLLGGATWVIRLWGALWAAATTCVVFVLARHLFDRHIAFIAALLFAIFSSAPHVEGFSANAETFMVLPASLSAYCLLRRKPAYAGLFASVALLLKPSGGVTVLLAIIWFTWERANWRVWSKFFMLLFPLPLLSLAHAGMTVGLQRYFDALVWYRLGVNIATGYQPEQSILVGWILTLPIWWPLTLLAIFGLRSLPREVAIFLLAWLITSIGGVALGGLWLMHYFLQLLPPLAILAGVGIMSLWRDRKRVKRIIAVVLLSLGMSLFLAFEGPFYLTQPAQGMWQLYYRSGYTIAEEAAAYIRTHSAPDDTLYVAFYQAEIYHLAQRRSTSPYLFHMDLVYLPGAYDSVITMVEERKPTYILVMYQPLSGALSEERFWQALARGYVVDKQFNGATLYHQRADVDASTTSATLPRSRTSDFLAEP